MENLLPLGSVVLLKESTKKVMIIGYCQKALSDDEIYDYSGCLFPEGYLGADKTFLFNRDQIEIVYYQAALELEQTRFLAYVENVIKEKKK